MSGTCQGRTKVPPVENHCSVAVVIDFCCGELPREELFMLSFHAVATPTDKHFHQNIQARNPGFRRFKSSLGDSIVQLIITLLFWEFVSKEKPGGCSG